MTKENVIEYISLLIQKGFFGEVVLSLQNGNVDTIKQKETLKQKDIEERMSLTN